MTDKSFETKKGDKTITWHDSGREPRCAPNPEFPNGIPFDIAGDAEAVCEVELPYPAPRCGTFVICCETCGYNIGVTTAGRPDDPVSIRYACQLQKKGH